MLFIDFRITTLIMEITDMFQRCVKIVEEEFEWNCHLFSVDYREYRLKRFLAGKLADPWTNPAAKIMFEWLINKKLEELGR